MTLVDIELPQLGEAVEEGTITRWFKQVGDTVTVDELLYEVSTEKVDAEVPSPVTGTIIELKIGEGETVPVGTVLAVVEGELATTAPRPVNSAKDSPAKPQSDPTSTATNQASKRRDTQDKTSDRRLLSPVVRLLMK